MELITVNGGIHIEQFAKTSDCKKGNASGCRSAIGGAKALRFLQLTCVLTLVVCMGLALCGCKDTEVLTQKIVDQRSEIIDHSLEPIRNEATDSNPDELWKGQFDESDAEETPDQQDPEYDKQDPTVDRATQERSPQENALNNRAATNSGSGDVDTNRSDGAGEGTGTGGEGNGDAQGDSGKDPDEESEPSQNTPQESNPDDAQETQEPQPGEAVEEPQDEPISDPGSNNQDGDEPQSGNGATGRTYDNTGSYAELPENTRSIAAVGQCATIVQMLSGGDTSHPTPLVAADAAWVGKVQSTGVFPGEGAGNVTVAWGDDGSSAGDLNMQALLAAKPDVVLVEADDGTITEDDQAVLEQNGINIVIMPALGRVTTTDADIVTAVRVVGELLKGANTQYDTVAAAQHYVSMHDECIENVLNANGGYSMKRYNGQVSEGSVIYQPDGDNGLKGIDTTRVSSNHIFLTSFADAIGGVSYADPEPYGGYDFSDGLALSAYRTGNNKWGLLFYYFQCAGVIDYTQSGYVAGLSNGRQILSYSHGHGDLIASGDHADPQGDPYGGFLVSLTEITASAKEIIELGDGWYPAIVARNSAIAQKIASSRDKASGFYHPRGNGYEVWVLPSGFAGDWVDGSVESYLAASWAYSAYHSRSLSDCDSYVNAYYETFYRTGANGVLEGYGSVY